MHMTAHLGDVVKWKLISVCLEVVLTSTQDRCTVCAQMHHRLRNYFGCTRWYSDVTWVKWSLVSVLLVIVLTSTQDSCTVCAKSTIGTESVWMHLMVLLGDVGPVESQFGAFGDGVSVGAR